MYRHAPRDYDCPFCRIAEGRFEGLVSARDDVVAQDEITTAFVASHQWPRNPGHVLVVPNIHVENLYSLPEELAIPIQRATRRIALALKRAFACPGVSTRQHNEPAGGQDVWHYHVHVFPRYLDDGLYGADRGAVGASERKLQAQQIRHALSGIPPDPARLT